MAEKPPIKWIGSPNFTPGRKGQRPVVIVCHIMAGSLAGTDSWFNNPQSKASAHFGVGKDGTIHQYVAEEDAAWANGRVQGVPWPAWADKPRVNPNLRSLSIEHEGQPDDGLTEAQYQASLALIRYLCERWAIPPDREHIIGHYQIDAINRPNCPGPRFPWERLIRDLSAPVPRVRIVVNLERDLEGELREGTTWAPARALAEALGAAVDWDPATRTVRIAGRLEGGKNLV